MTSYLARLLLIGFSVTLAPFAQAQNQPAQTQPAQTQPASPSGELLRSQELDQLVAPIALYPDALLANVLMASTYPLEVIEASRWADANKGLKGEALKSAVDKQAWDDSVKQLTATPTVLTMMSGKLPWLQKLGDAVLAQQPDVMDAVQRLRTKAQANNKLQSTREQKVSVRTESNRQVVVIEPTDPNTIYVPYYDPGVVFGAWPYPEYPPYYFTPYPGWVAGGVIASGLAFGAGVAVGIWGANHGWWGGGFNWGNNNINVNRNINVNNINNNWRHNPAHRQGVRYNNQNVANQFNRGNNVRNNAQNRMDFRGRDGQQVLRPDRPGAGGAGERRDIGDRAGDRAGNRPGGGDRAGNRPGAGDRAGDRAGNRPGGGERRDAGNRGGNRPGAGGGGQRRDAANRGGGNRAHAAARGGGSRGSAFSGVRGGGHAAMAQSMRGHASMGGFRGGGGGMRAAGGGGFRGGGGGGFRGGGGGRRSDIELKHDVVLLGVLDNGLGFYRFAYNGSDKAYVGVIAQEVQTVKPDAVGRGTDGYLRVRYDRLGVKFQTYDQWLGSGSRIPSVRTH